MNALVAWFARNRVAANLLMALLVVGGIVALPRIAQKAFPDITVDMVSVSVPYPGASPEEVERGVCIPVEEEIAGVDGVDRLQTTAAEGACAVVAELLQGADTNAALSDVKTRVDAIDTFPEEAEEPVVSSVTLRRAVADVAISGGVDEARLKEVGERVRDEIAALPGITQADLVLVRPYEIAIEVSENSLRRYGLTFAEVAEAVRRSSIDLPGGRLKTEGGEILLRTRGQAYRGDEFERIVVRTRPDGTRITVGDVAQVVDGFADVDLRSRFDGRPAAVVQVYRVGDQDVIDISEAVHRYVAEARAEMPEGLSLTVWQDDSKVLRGRLDTLLRNGRSGFLLVLGVLALFLRPRVAIWVALGVPIAFLGALSLFLPLGLSIDMITLFAFILVLGILVDDAIVVGESVHAEQERTGDREAGAVRGTQRVAVPVVFGVLTTVAAFVPLLLVPGTMGQVFAVMGSVVILCLALSLVESQLVLPAHLAHGRERPGDAEGRGRLSRLQRRVARGLERAGQGPYRRLLDRALLWRYATLTGAVALLAVAVAIVGTGRLGFSFFPPVEGDYLAARLTMPQGTPVEVTAEAVRHIEASAEALRRELDPQHAPAGESLVQHVLASVGSQPFQSRQDRGAALRPDAGGSGHLGEVALELLPSERRRLSARRIGERWRELVGPIPGAEELVYASDLFSAGEALYVQLRGRDVDDLERAGARLKERLAAYPGVFDVSDTARAGKQELELHIRPSAEALGVTQRDLARQVRQAFYGEEVQRIQRGPDEVRVMVRYPDAERRALGDLERMRIRTPAGVEVPFATVAEAELGRGYASIRRTDRQRVVGVTADVDRTVTTANEVMADLRERVLPGILADHPGVSYSLEGEQREQRRALAGLAAGYGLALFAIYALLAVPLRSYLQPLLIMSVIPFGLVGAVAGHLAFGPKLGWIVSIMSVIGFVALSGVVVNASLVLVHTVNALRTEGLSAGSAVREAAVNRFRPIVLTSLTTFVGLLPLILERSVQAQFLIPMAISLAFGVLFAAVVTLLVLPSGILVVEDVTRALRRAVAGRLGEADAAAGEALPHREGGAAEPA